MSQAIGHLSPLTFERRQIALWKVSRILGECLSVFYKKYLVRKYLKCEPLLSKKLKEVIDMFFLPVYQKKNSLIDKSIIK